MKTKRYSIIGLLCIIAVFSMSMFFVSCKKPGTDVEFTQTGVYYAIEGEDEWTFSVTKDSFSLTLAGKEYSGDYTFDGSVLTLTAKDGTTFTATVQGDGLMVSANGKQYEFLKKFTVTFSVDGKTFTKEVLSGKVIATPEAPVKDGYVFVGWYKDRATTVPFDFSAGVKSDVTVYGKFVKQTDNEFTVSFYDGTTRLDSYSAKTVNHRLGELPVLTKENYEFLGWWLSDFDDSAKLTKKVETDEEVNSDVKLFAVWQNKGEKALTVSVAVAVDGKANIIWNAIRTGLEYTVTVNGPEGAAKSERTYLNNLAFDFGALSAGEYEISVLASNGTSGKAYVNNKGLNKVAGLEVSESDTGTLVFKNVEGADYYLLTVICNNEVHNHSEVRLERTSGELVAYDFSGCDMTEEGMTFRVVACSNAGGKSIPAELFVLQALYDVTDINYNADAGTISWNEVFADYYYVTVTAGEKKVTAKVYDITYSVGKFKGTVNVTVTGYKKGYVTSNTATGSFVRDNLLMPDGLRISDGVLYWNGVEGAVSYSVKIGGSTFTTKDKVDGLYYFNVAPYITGESVTISVKAVANDESLNSAENEIVVSASKFNEIKYENRVLTWAPVANGTTYHLTVNGGREITYAARDLYSYTFDASGAGKYTVKLWVTDRSNKVLDEKTFDINFYSVSFEAGEDNKLEPVYVAEGDALVLPEVTRDGYDFEGWYLTDKGPDGGKKYVSDIFDGNENITLYAYFIPKKHMVRLDVGDYGTLPEEELTQEIAFGSEFTLPVPTANDASEMAFIGWYRGLMGRDTRYTNQYGEGLNPFDKNEDITLHAFWASVFKYEETTTEDEDHSKAYRVRGGDGINFVTEVTIPETVNGIPVITIDAGAFKNCSNLQIVNFYSSMEHVEVGDETGANSAFEGCSNLKAINVLPSAKEVKAKYFSSKGVLCGYSRISKKSEVLVVPNSVIGTLELPDGVEVIKTNAFNNKNITTIVIPATVEEINESAFEDCKELVNVIFKGTDSEDAKPLSIAKYAFRRCSSLQSVTFPARLASFDRKAFDSCTDLVEVNVSRSMDEVTEYYSKNGVLIRGKDGAATLEYVPTGLSGEFTVPDGVSTIGSLSFAGTRISTVIIPKNVTVIEPYAFGGVENQDGKSYTGRFEGDFYAPASWVEKVVFEGTEADKPLTIGEGAFYGTRLYKNEIVLPENLISLGKYAFGGIGSGFTTRRLAVRVETSLQDAVFETGAFATFVNTGDGGVDVFSVYKLYLGENVPFMEIGGIFGDNNIEEIEVSPANPNFKEKDNVLFNSDYSNIVYFPGTITGTYEIPGTVTKISDGVFASKSIEKVIIPASVETIGVRAFFGAKLLTTVEFKDGENAADLVIEENAFDRCVSLVDINLPSRLKVIKTRAFYDCGDLVEVIVPEGVEEIGEYAFASCDSLKNVYLPASLKKLGIIGSDDTGATDETGSKLTVFKDSNAIENLVVAEGNTVVISDSGVLYIEKEDEEGNLVSELVYSPAGKTGELTLRANLVKVWDRAFYYNTLLEKIVFRDGERSDLKFGDSIFEGCINLKELILPVGLKTIGYGLFDGCASLETITVPYTVETISYGAFRRGHTSLSSNKKYGCENLKTIVFGETPEGKEEVPLTIQGGAYKHGGTLSFNVVTAFFGTALEEVVLPARTVYVGDYAFAGIASLKKVTIPKGVKFLGQGAFYNSGVTDVVFEEGSAITAIPAYCFAETPIGGSETANGTLILPEGVKSIGYKAFNKCKSLTAITIPSSVEEIGSTYFVSNFYIPSEDTILINYTKDSKGNIVKVEEKTVDGEVFAESTLASVTFAKKDGKASLAYIYKKGFASTKLTKVSIPSSISEIREEAFGSNSLLEEVVFETYDDGGKQVSNLTLIGDKAFALGSSAPMTSFAFPETKAGTMTLGTSLFSSCSHLSTIYLSDSVTDITGLLTGISSRKILLQVSDDHPTLSLDKNLPFVTNKAGDTIQSVYTQITPDNEDGTVVIPEGYTTIMPKAFVGQTKIAKLVLPSTIQKIGSEAFKGIKSLTDVSFARNKDGKSVLSYMGIDVFMDCSGLVKAEIPGELGYVPDGTFRACSSLKEVTLGEGIKTIGRIGLTSWVDFGNNTLTRDQLYFDDIEFANGKLVTTQNYNGINTYTFYNCTALTTIKTKPSDPDNVATLPSTLKELGNYAFSTAGLISVILPEQITSIGGSEYWQCLQNKAPTKQSAGTRYIFNNCKSLVSVYAKGTITKISEYAFQNASSFTTFKTKNSDPDGKVTLPDSCTELGNYSFEGTGITEFNLNKVTTIGTYLFRNTVNLQSVDLGGITALTKYMFSGSGISSIDISKVKSFDTNVFEKCANLTSVELNEEVTTLPASAFASSGLTSIDLTHITSLGAYAFDGCANLASVTNETNLSTIGSYAFRNTAITSFSLAKMTAVPVSMFEGCTKLTKVTGTEQITVVNKNSFKGSGIKNLDLPKVTKIDTSAFEDCADLTSVTSTQLLATLNGSAFKNSGITSLDITKIKTISANVFEGCVNLTELTNTSGVTSIGDSAFKNTAIVEIDMPNVTSIASSAFEGCTKLKNVKVKHAGATTIASKAFYGSSIENFNNDVKDEKIINLDGIKKIDVNAFAETTGIKKVIMPTWDDDGDSSANYVVPTTMFKNSSVVEVDMSGIRQLNLTKRSYSEIRNDKPGTPQTNIFEGCANLEKVVLSDEITSLPARMFLNSGIKYINLGKVKEIGESVFENCENFVGSETLNAPELDSLEVIGAYAFKNCVLLTGEAVLPVNLKTVGGFAFVGTKISSYKNTLGNTNFLVKDGILYSKDGTTIVSVAPEYEGTVTLGEGVKVGDYAFVGTSKLTFVFEEGLTEIGDYAFSGLTNLTEVTLPSTLTHIGAGAFMNTGITSIAFPDALTYLGDYAFMGTGITEVTLPKNLETFGAQVFANTGVTKITLPAKVTTLKASAFEGYTKLELLDFGSVKTLAAGVLGNAGSEIAEGKTFKVTIPETVTTFPTKAFNNSFVTELVINTPNTATATYLFSNGTSSSSIINTTLTKVTFGKDVETVANYMFLNCTSLKTFESSTVKTIGQYAFSNTGLETYTVPDTVTEIGNYAFSKNLNLTSFIFGKGMTSTGTKGILSDCTALTTAVVPEGYTEISKNTFERCTALTNFVLPESVVLLGEYSFNTCTSLKSIVLSENCVVVARAFRNWVAGQTIYFKGTKDFAEEYWGTPVNDLIGDYIGFDSCDIVYNYKAN